MSYDVNYALFESDSSQLIAFDGDLAGTGFVGTARTDLIWDGEFDD